MAGRGSGIGEIYQPPRTAAGTFAAPLRGA